MNRRVRSNGLGTVFTQLFDERWFMKSTVPGG